jgi:site-specific DNA-cytosine methylase
MAEGLRRAGIAIDIAFDYDADACASYTANLGHAPVRIDVNDLARMARDGWRTGPIDLLIADPPCTPWSRAGKRQGRSDERDMLDVTVELVRLLRPRAYLIANVPGLDDGPNWPIVQETIGGLARDGYCVRDFARLDAADFGVPQRRVRPFWYGHLDGPCLVWPSRTHGAPHECGPTLHGVARLEPWVTCRQALGHLSPEDLGTPVRLRWRGCSGTQVASVPDRPARVVGTSNLSDGNVLATPEAARVDRRKQRDPGRKARASHVDEPASVVTTRCNGDGNTLFDGPNHRPSRADAPDRSLTRNTRGDGALLVNDRHPVNQLDEPSFTVTSKGGGRGAQGACVLAYDGHPISRPDEPGLVVPSSQPRNSGAVIEWPWDRPSTVVTTRPGLAEPGHHTVSNLSTANAIKLSEKAAAILQGFPPGWVFHGATKRARWAQIGMAVPPPLAEAVGKSIERARRRTEAA